MFSHEQLPSWAEPGVQVQLKDQELVLGNSRKSQMLLGIGNSGQGTHKS